MDLKQQLMADLKTSMKSGDATRTQTIRALRGAIKNAEIDSKSELSNQEIQAIISKQAKQRRDSITEYRKADRLDLVEQEEQELLIIETYLPPQLSDAEIEERAKAVIAELGVTDKKGMGIVMKRLSQDLKGVADGKRISAVVSNLLK